ncbi:MAG: argininosuccinate lyase [Nitrospirales bacterium]|nr:MAG: argininosuccinate lyase [Nitrospirales bacterium]
MAQHPRKKLESRVRSNTKTRIATTTKKGTSSRSQPKKLWGGRFKKHTHHLVERFTSSLPFDQRLYHYDILGSIAHCKTLHHAKVITKQECLTIIRGLEKVLIEIQRGRFEFRNEDEDIHMSIERRLTQLIGPLGGKLHTGRSRNDQVALDLRLYVRESLKTLTTGLQQLQKAMIVQARKNINVIMPGYTHLQRAQPVLFAHHFLAYVEMFERDKGRLTDALTRLNVLPLGAGALAGTNYPIDRIYTAKLLDFPAVTTNSLDTVSDRDFVVEALNACSLLMMHLSRLSEEFILWSSQEFQFIEMSDSFCTGSSMMPQKKNPDVAELVRGKTGRVYGHLMSVLTTLKGLPLSYNRDLQEDKEPLFDTVDTVTDSVSIYAELIKRLKVRQDVMAEAVQSGLLFATELADYLVRKGVPFREAHAIIGSLVGQCAAQKKDLAHITLQELRSHSSHFSKDALHLLTPEGAIQRKDQIGGTARKQVQNRLRILEKRLL